MHCTRKFLIGRQPILDQSKQVVAYELLFRSAESLASAHLKDPSHATANVIVNTLSGFGIADLLGGRRGFINIDIDLLMSGAIEILPGECVGLELQEGIGASAEVIERCRELKQGGFVFALDGHTYLPDHEPLYQVADIVKIDLTQTPAIKLKEQVELFKTHGMKLLAEKIDTGTAFTICRDLGFDLFQGYFFARPTIVEKNSISDSKAPLLKLLRLLLADALTGDIIEVFKTDPGLTYRLLLLVNSVAFGVREKIRDVRHAITILGRQQLKRWVQLSMFSAEGTADGGNPLLEMAVSRGSFMEELALHHPVLQNRYGAADQAFMVGILSLLEEIYKVSLDQLVADLNLSDDIHEALMYRTGMFGQLLDLTLLIERFELGAASLGLEDLGISLDDIIESQIEALRKSRALCC